MDAIAMLAVILIGLLVFGAAAAAFGADSRDEFADDDPTRLRPLI